MNGHTLDAVIVAARNLAALVALACAFSLLATPYALGHAALVDAETAPAIRLHAYYETGEPMAEAQVIIYAPDAPGQVWRRGVTDSEGRFEFVPAPVPGRWSVQVRQAGHGAMAHVDMGASAPAAVAAVAVASPAPAPASWLERLVMIGLVAWGALGTALYFRREKGVRDASA